MALDDPAALSRRCLIALTDITERRQAEEHSRYLASIVEFSRDAIIGVDLGGRILSWNTGAERVYGFTATEMLGRQIRDLAPPGRTEETAKLTEAMLQGRSISHFETKRLRKDGVPVGRLPQHVPHPRCGRDHCRPVHHRPGRHLPQTPAPGTGGGQARGRGGQPRQKRIFGQHEPRDPQSHQRHPGPDPARALRRGPPGKTGPAPVHGPRILREPAAHRGATCWIIPRSRPASWSWRSDPSQSGGWWPRWWTNNGWPPSTRDLSCARPCMRPCRPGWWAMPSVCARS